jgi:integrase
MRRNPYLVRRGSTYHFRVRIPVQLRPAVGRVELWRSLHTTHIVEARRRSLRMLGLTDRLWSALHSAMTPTEAQRLVDQWLEAKLEEHADIRDLPLRPEHHAVIFRRGTQWGADEVVETLSEEAFRTRMLRHFTGAELIPSDCEIRHKLGPRGIAWHNFSKLTERAEANRREDEDKLARPTLLAWMKAHGVEVDEASQGFRAGVRFMLKAQANLQQATTAREDSAWYRWSGPDPAERFYPSAADAAPAPPLGETSPPPQPAATLAATPGLTEPVPHTGEERLRFSVAAAEALREIARTEEQRNMRREEYAKAVELFSGWLGVDLFLDEITARTAGHYKVDLTYYPKNATKRREYKALSVPERIVAAKAANEPTLLDATTINSKYLTPLRRVFEWLKWAGRGVTVNPFDGVNATKSKRSNPNTQRREFTDGEVAALLALPLFTGAKGAKHKPLYKPGPVRVSDWRFWVPLICLYSGMRLGEACALAVADINERDGIRYMHVRDLIEGQNAKSDAARRKVPIHRELLAAGFLDFVEQARKAGHERLFPDLEVNADGYVSDRPQKFFEHVIERAKDPDAEEPGKLVFHSTRHTVVGKLRTPNCREDISTEILGHEQVGTHATYGGVALLTLQQWVNEISYEGAQMERVKQPYSTWPPAGVSD